MATPNPTRYPNGVSDSLASSPFGLFAGLDPSRYFIHWDDFTRYTAADWVVSASGGSVAALDASLPGGVLTLTNAGALANDIISLQWAGGSGAVSRQFTFDATKDMFIAARVSASHGNNASWAIGVSDTDTDPIANLANNAVMINKLTGADLLGTRRAAAVASSVTLAASPLTANSYYVPAMVYTAKDTKWRGYLDGVAVGSLATAGGPTGAMAPTLAVMNATNAAQSLAIDWLFIARQR